MSIGFLNSLPWPEVVRYLRRRSELSQGQICIRLGRTQGHWSQLENGCRNMTLDEFIEFANSHGESVIVAGIELAQRSKNYHENK